MTSRFNEQAATLPGTYYQSNLRLITGYGYWLPELMRQLYEEEFSRKQHLEMAVGTATEHTAQKIVVCIIYHP